MKSSKKCRHQPLVFQGKGRVRVSVTDTDIFTHARGQRDFFGDTTAIEKERKILFLLSRGATTAVCVNTHSGKMACVVIQARRGRERKRERERR